MPYYYNSYAKAECSVYVVAADCGLVKIGHAEVPHNRLLDLRIGSPSPLHLFRAFTFTAARKTGNHKPKEWVKYLASHTEKSCHKALSEFRRHGEWFEIDPETAWRCVEEQAQRTSANPPDPQAFRKRYAPDPRPPRPPRKPKAARADDRFTRQIEQKNNRFLQLLAGERNL